MYVVENSAGYVIFTSSSLEECQAFVDNNPGASLNIFEECEF